MRRVIPAPNKSPARTPVVAVARFASLALAVALTLAGCSSSHNLASGASCTQGDTCVTGDICFQNECHPLPGYSCDPHVAACVPGATCQSLKCVALVSETCGPQTNAATIGCEQGAICVASGSAGAGKQTSICDPGAGMACGGELELPCAPGLECIEDVCRVALHGACDNTQAICGTGLTCIAGSCLTSRNGSCTSDGDCIPGSECPNGQCVGNSGAACSSNEPCGPALSCKGGQCVSNINGPCGDKKPCATGATCVNNVCKGEIGASCQVDGDCEPGFGCQAGKCAGEGGSACTDQDPCTGGFICEAGVCAADLDGTCNAKVACASGLTCLNGTCKGEPGAPCENSDDCVPGYDCHAGACAGEGGSTCSDDAPCTTGFVCEDSVCKAVVGGTCSAPTDCAVNETCANGTCQGALGAACHFASDCAPDYDCVQDACLGAGGGQCTVDSGCVAGFTCNQGICGAVFGGACSAQVPCGSGFACDNGVCKDAVGTACASASDCASGSDCHDGVCSGEGASPCSSQAPCMPAFTCVANTCDANLGGACGSAVSCATGLACVNGDCKGSVGSACQSDSDCATNLFCRGGTCGSCSDGIKDGAETDVDCGGPDCQPCAAGKPCLAGRDCTSNDCTGGICAPGDCKDGKQDGTETDVDCGGTCPGCKAGQKCDVNADCAGGACENGVCQDPTCTDQIKDGDETDVDCGGSCPGCALGKACSTWRDCASRSCTDGACTVGTCTDQITNGSETDVDCGGGPDSARGGAACPACADGLACKVDSDCQSGVCENDICQKPSCTDGVKNGQETDVDCGGPDCPACAFGQTCSTYTDCVTRACVNGVCNSGTCTDGIQNGQETDVDCGGPICLQCAPGKACLVNTDCTSMVCKANVCQAPTCSDGVKNGNETGVDCGGSCPPCGPAAQCKVGSDCQSGVCIQGQCATATCTDKVKNGAETDVDCGGGTCPKCGEGKTCHLNSDCYNGNCVMSGLTGVCTATCSDGFKDGAETDVDCGGGTCPTCANGKSCSVASDCQSGVCNGGRCAVPTCSDGVMNGDETGIDCGGSCPSACANGNTCNTNGDCDSLNCVGGYCTPVTAGTWDQSSWTSHPIDPDPILAHSPQNETGWNHFYTASSDVGTGSGLSMLPRTVDVIDTTDGDFGAGTLTGLTIDGTGTAAYLSLAGGTDYGNGSDGPLVIDGQTASNSTDGQAHPWWLANISSLTATAEGGGALAAGTYYYAVTATSAAGRTSTSNTPAAQATVAANGAISLTWNAISCATGYVIWRYRSWCDSWRRGSCNGTAYGWDDIGNVSAPTVQFVDSGTATAVQTVGCSPNWQGWPIATLANCSGGDPDTSGNPYMANRPLDVTQMTVQNCAGIDVSGVQDLSTASGLSGVVVPGAGSIPPGVTYTYEVKAVDYGGAEARSGPLATIPVTQTDSGVRLSWPAIPWAMAYHVYRGVNGSFADPSLVCDTTGTTCLDTLVTPDKGAPCTDCNGEAYGRAVIRSLGTISIDSTSLINVAVRGYPGGGGNCGGNTYPTQGWSYEGQPGESTSALFSGGGDDGSGGGHGAQGAGSNGGATWGTDSLALLTIGAGGGGDCGGGTGAGGVYLSGSDVTLEGTIDAWGQNAWNGTGGGAGGGVRIDAPAISLGQSAVINVSGGPGGGGGGRIAFHAVTLNGQAVGGATPVTLPDGVTAGSGALAGTIYQGKLGTFSNTGTYVSAAHDAGEPIVQVGPVTFAANIPQGTSIQVQIASSKDGTTFGPYLGPDCTSNTSYSSGENLCDKALGDQYLKWQISFSGNGTISPTLDSLQVEVGVRQSPLVLVSSPFDTGDDTIAISSLKWTQDLPTGTLAQFQIRTAPDSGTGPGTWSAWMGPTGTSDWYTDPAAGTVNSVFADGSNDRWVQYQVQLGSTVTDTPSVSDVQIAYAATHGVDLVADGNGAGRIGTLTNGLGGTSALNITQGGTATSTVELKNTGSGSDSYELAVIPPPGFTYTVDGETGPQVVGPQAANASSSHAIAITAPSNASGTAKVIVSAYSIGDQTKVDSVTLSLTVK